MKWYSELAHAARSRGNTKPRRLWNHRQGNRFAQQLMSLPAIVRERLVRVGRLFHSQASDRIFIEAPSAIRRTPPDSIPDFPRSNGHTNWHSALGTASVNSTPLVRRSGCNRVHGNVLPLLLATAFVSGSRHGFPHGPHPNLARHA